MSGVSHADPCQNRTAGDRIRAAIQRSKASLQALSGRYGINPKSVAKWRTRTSLEDRPMGPKVLATLADICAGGSSARLTGFPKSRADAFQLIANPLTRLRFAAHAADDFLGALVRVRARRVVPAPAPGVAHAARRLELGRRERPIGEHVLPRSVAICAAVRRRRDMVVSRRLGALHSEIGGRKGRCGRFASARINCASSVAERQSRSALCRDPHHILVRTGADPTPFDRGLARGATSSVAIPNLKLEYARVPYTTPSVIGPLM